MTFFENVTTLDELKAQYKKLIKKYHPDLNRDTDTTETMKAVNAEYDRLFEQVKNQRKTADGKSYTRETTETPEQFRTIINAIINLNGIDIDLVGSWIWVTGDTLTNKDALKAAGLKFAGKKKAWYWHAPEDRCSRGSKMSLDEIKEKYGSERIVAAEKKPEIA